MKKLFLASQSPRRSELLREAGIPFQVLSVKVSEIPKKNLNPQEQIVDLARQKAEAAIEAANGLKLEGFLILTADTMVILEDEPLGKPNNSTEARLTLERLSGRWHEVVTAICLYDAETKDLKSDFARTRVKFRELSQKEIEDYIATGEHEDKAGSYGIQGVAGNFVEQIEGPYDNVVGLPVALVKNLIEELRGCAKRPDSGLD